MTKISKPKIDPTTIATVWHSMQIDLLGDAALG